MKAARSTPRASVHDQTVSHFSETPLPMKRRDFLSALTAGSAAILSGCHPTPRHRGASNVARLFFTSAGKTCLIHADGSGFRTLEFNVPNQATWQPGGFFSDGRRVLFLSMEPRRDGPGRPFEEFYTQTPHSPVGA
jgi:hypothetical protein